MPKNLTGRKLGIIHAALITTRAVQKYIDEVIPEVEIVHWVDDTIQNTNFACEPGTIPKKNYAKFVQGALSQEEYGVDLILLACSTFNRAVEHARPMINTPMLQIDRPMMDLAVQHGQANRSFGNCTHHSSCFRTFIAIGRRRGRKKNRCRHPLVQ